MIDVAAATGCSMSNVRRNGVNCTKNYTNNQHPTTDIGLSFAITSLFIRIPRAQLILFNLHIVQVIVYERPQ